MDRGVKALRIKVHLPSAHFRYPFTFRRRITYPIPPYSTVLGFLMNIFNPGREYPKEEIRNKFREIEISICGNFEAKVSSQYWFRNLNKEKSHVKRFGSPFNRIKDFEIEHPGGQSPVYVETLENVKIWIYITNKEFKEEETGIVQDIYKRLTEEIDKVIEPLHLGRAEDLISDIEVEKVCLEEGEANGNYRKFFWIPAEGKYKNKDLGILQKVTTFYDIVDDVRSFKFIEAYLSDGVLFKVPALIDRGEDLPVFFAKFYETGEE